MFDVEWKTIERRVFCTLLCFVSFNGYRFVVH